MSQVLGAEVLARLSDEEPDKNITLSSEQNSIGETILAVEGGVAVNHDPSNESAEVSVSEDLAPPTTPLPPTTTTVSPPLKKVFPKKKPSTESQT
jgi:hypothetical protein